MMHATLERFLNVSVFLVMTQAMCGQVSAQTLPPFERFPPEAPQRLAQAVEKSVHAYADAFADALSGVAPQRLDQPELVRSLWESIEGAIGAPSSGGSGSAPLLDVLDGAIGAYMTELGHIAHEIDRRGNGDTVETLAPLHPGEQGSGAIAVGTVGPFRQLAVTFRGEIAHPDGRSPAVVAMFYLRSGPAGPPIPGRLLIPTTGGAPSFRAEIASHNGEPEVRDYGWRPRLARTSSILELMVDGRWTRVEDEVDVAPRRRAFRDAPGFCDATCTQR